MAVINPGKGIASWGETARAQAKSKLKTGSKRQEGTRPDPGRHEHQINQAAGVMGCFLTGPARHNRWIPPFCFDGKCKNPTFNCCGQKEAQTIIWFRWKTDFSESSVSYGNIYPGPCTFLGSWRSKRKRNNRITSAWWLKVRPQTDVFAAMLLLYLINVHVI